ncbi:MAG: hypothetical protein LUC22_01405 [Prevotella sp.]|nr:hypothetical protein [Prevotella sp.]
MANKDRSYLGEAWDFYDALLRIVFGDYGILTNDEERKRNIWLPLVRIIRADFTQEMCMGEEQLLDIRYNPGVVSMAIEEYDG